MTPEERDALLAEFLAGTIAATDRDRLLRELRGDPKFARGATDLWVVEKLLSFELDTRARKVFVEEVSERLQAETPGSASELTEEELDMVAGGLGDAPPPPPPEDDDPASGP